MIKKVVIVGGGFAGWYTAAFLTKNFPQLDLTVIDSNKHPRMGVGETFGWSAPYDQKKLLHLENDRMLMWETGAIYKYGIQPINFWDHSSHYHYGKFYNLKVNALVNFFGTYDYNNYLENWNKEDGSIGLLQAWISLNQNSNKNFEDYCLETNDSMFFAKFPWAPYQNGHYILRPQEGWSYHMDVEKTVTLFKSLSKSAQVTSAITNIEFQDNNISFIKLENQEIVKADLFIDCSGFSRVLTKQNIAFEWIDLGDRFNNSACVIPTRYTDPHNQIIGSTSVIGEDWGWRFKVPLYHRQGNGYIFNDNLVDPEKILEYIKNSFQKDAIKDPKILKWRPGYYKKSFVGNTLSLGVSSHFVDPHDGPSYDLHSRNLEDFLKHFNSENVSEFQNNFNKSHAICSEERLMRLITTFGSSKRQGFYWNTWRDTFVDFGYEKRLVDLMNDKEIIGTRLSHFFQQIYYKLWIINNYERNKIKIKSMNENEKVMAQSFFEYFKNRNQYIKNSDWPNYYEWLKENRFNGQSHDEVLERLG